jgi:hypothetical protein
VHATRATAPTGDPGAQAAGDASARTAVADLAAIRARLERGGQQVAPAACAFEQLADVRLERMLLFVLEIGRELQLEMDIGQRLAVGRGGLDPGPVVNERVVRLHEGSPPSVLAVAPSLCGGCRGVVGPGPSAALDGYDASVAQHGSGLT